MNTPADIRIRRAPDGQLLLHRDDATIPVRVRRCFPWTHPRGWISLCDTEGAEALLLPDLSVLSPDSAAALSDELNLIDRTFVITRIHACTKEIELRCWEVDTEQGPRMFQTELDEWPRCFGHGGVLIRDLHGDLYTVPDPEALDPDSKKRLWMLLD